MASAAVKPTLAASVEPLEVDLDTTCEVFAAAECIECATDVENNRVVVLKTSKSLSYQSSQGSPDSPRKGSLKKKGFVRGLSEQAARSPAKAVRWKDMIEIKSCVNDSDCESETERSFFSDLSNEAEGRADGPRESGGALLQTNVHRDIIITSEKKSYNVSRKTEGTEHKFNLKPLHATGKEFEKEMTERIERLNQIKTKNVVDVR